MICSDDSGGAIVAWKDMRGNDADIYASRVYSIGHLSGAVIGAAPLSSSPVLCPPYPHPATDRIMLPLFLPTAASVTITLYTLMGTTAMTVRTGDILQAGYHALAADVGRLPHGMYICLLRTSGALQTSRKILVR